MQTLKKNGRRWRRGGKIDPLLVVRSRDSCHRSSPYGHSGAMLRVLRLPMSVSAVRKKVSTRLNIPDEVPQPLLGGTESFAALVVILSRYVVGSLGGLSSHTEWHCSMVSDRSSMHCRTEREKRPGWCWDRSQNN